MRTVERRHRVGAFAGMGLVLMLVGLGVCFMSLGVGLFVVFTGIAVAVTGHFA